MQSNAKYTAKEILTEAGIDLEVVGKVRVRIGGVPVNTLDHVVGIPAEVNELEIIIGNEVKTLPVPETAEERVISEDTHRVKEEIERPRISAAIAELQRAKAKAKKEAKKEANKKLAEAAKAEENPEA